MANDPKSRWSKRTAELPTAKSDVKEMSLNERLKLVRSPGQSHTNKDGIPRNAFGDKITKAADIEERRSRNATVIQAPTVKPIKVGMTTLDPETVAAKEAYEASRQNATNQKSRAARIEAVMSTLSQDDADAILRGFCAKVPAFYSSPFNVQNLIELWKHAFAQGVDGVDAFNIKALTICYEWGAAQTQPPFFEPKMRLRGQMAAQVFTCPAEETPEPERVAPTTVRVREVTTPEEQAELKNMDFDELKRKATSTFQPRRLDISDYRG